jgi:hypothetical protein
MELNLKEQNSQNVAPISVLIISPHQQCIPKQMGKLNAPMGASARHEDEDVPGLEGKGQKLTQRTTLSIMGPANQH